MITGPVCKPFATNKASAPATNDVFGFGAAAGDTQTMQNMMVMMTMPWMAFWALGSEMAHEVFRNPFTS